jgi:hypothetical protein
MERLIGIPYSAEIWELTSLNTLRNYGQKISLCILHFMNVTARKFFKKVNRNIAIDKSLFIFASWE